MTIRPATARDVGVLERLLRRSWLTTWAPELPFEAVQRFAHDDTAGAYARARWADMMVLVAGGSVVGMVHMRATKSAPSTLTPLISATALALA